jgi:hypothetical protein
MRTIHGSVIGRFLISFVAAAALFGLWASVSQCATWKCVGVVGSPQWTDDDDLNSPPAPFWRFCQVNDIYLDCYHLLLGPLDQVVLERLDPPTLCGNSYILKGEDPISLYHLTTSYERTDIELYAGEVPGVGSISASHVQISDGPGCSGSGHCGIRAIMPVPFAMAVPTDTFYTELYGCLQNDPAFECITATFWSAPGSDPNSPLEVRYGYGFENSVVLYSREWVKIAESGDYVDWGYSDEPPACCGGLPSSIEGTTWGAVKDLFR